MNVGGEGVSSCYRALVSLSCVSFVKSYTYLSSLGIIVVGKVRGVGNEVECGIILEVGTCIQQRARMLWAASEIGLSGLNERVEREIRDLPDRTS